MPNCEEPDELRGSRYSDKVVEGLWLSVCLEGPEIAAFERVQEYYGLRTRSSVMRLLITQEARRVALEEESWVK